MKKILLTGASGFIGRQCLAPLLDKGFEIHALSLNHVAGFEKDVVWHCQNFLDNEKTQQLVEYIRPSHCLHLAWYTEPGKYWSSFENLAWTASSLALVQSFQQKGGQRFVGAGTCAEYDWRYGHCSEYVTPLHPATLYGTCKNSLQTILASFSASATLSSAWGRIFFLYGPNEHPTRLVPSVVNSLLHGELALCSHGNQIRDFMHVSDVAEAFLSLLESEVTGPVNIASGRPVLIKDIIYKIAEHLDSVHMIRLGALPAQNEPALLTANISRLQNEVGFSPKFDLEVGLEETIDWWKRVLREKKG